jgi:transcriptional regulator with XRE-family HTH domain
MEVQDLVYPPSRSLPEIALEIDDVRERLGAALAGAAWARDRLDSAQAAMHNAQAAYEASETEVAVLEGRLASLSVDREKAAGWDPPGDSLLPEGSDNADEGAVGPTALSIAQFGGGSAVLRIVVGAQLRRLREGAGITMEQAGHAIRVSRSKIARLEAGRTGFKERDIADLLLLYGVRDEKERLALRKLAQQANAPDWWHDYSDILPDWFEAYIGLEMAVTDMRVYEVRTIPELLQTPDYSRAATSLGRASVSAEETERKVRLRMARQEHFLGRPNPPRLWAVLDEAVLQRNVGSPAVMRDQIAHLAEIAKQPNITIQVLPLRNGNDRAGGSFSILRFAGSDLRDVVYLEQLTSALYLDRPEDVDTYLGVMENIALQALDPLPTTQFLQELLASM